jgi:hypothetical protein
LAGFVGVAGYGVPEDGEAGVLGDEAPDDLGAALADVFVQLDLRADGREDGVDGAADLGGAGEGDAGVPTAHVAGGLADDEDAIVPLGQVPQIQAHVRPQVLPPIRVKGPLVLRQARQIGEPLVYAV